MKLIILIIFLCSFINSIIASGCVKRIYTVSEVNPFENNTPVAITGEFCTSNSTGVVISFLVGNTAIYCENIVISKNEDYITCTIINGASEPNEPFDYSSFNIVFVNIPTTTITLEDIEITPKPILGIGNYLYTSATCPTNCRDNGVCDIGMTCRCNEGYASFDCSQKIKNNTISEGPIGIISSNSNNTFTIFSNGDSYDITLINVIALSPEDSSYNTFQSKFPPSETSQTITPSEMTFLYNNTIEESWLSSVLYNVYFTNTTSPSFSLSNFKGAYLPITTSSVLISITPTVNITSLPNEFKNSTGYGRYSMVYLISNSNNVLAYDASLELSDSSNSVSLIDKKTNSLLVLSISDIYTFNQSIVSNHSYIEIISQDDAQDLHDYSATNIYIGVVIQQSFTTDNQPLSGSYNIQLSINVYNTAEPSLPYPIWEIILMVFGSLFIITLFVIAIGFFIKSRRHHDLHHHLNYRSKYSNDESKYLLK